MSEKQSDWLLDWARKGLEDKDVEASCQRELSKKKERSGKCLDYQEVDLTGNSISWKSCDAIVDLCNACQDLRVLKLSKNRLCDRATPALCRLLRQCNSIEQVHLSRNQLTDSGASSLVAAAQDVRLSTTGAPAGKTFPIWMRLEQNCISQPDALLEELRSRPSKASSSSSSCGACNAGDPQKCGPRACDRAALVHLPYFTRQTTRQPNEQSKVVPVVCVDPEDAIAEGNRETQGKARSPSRTQSPELEAPTASAGTPTVPETESPTSGSASPGLVIVPKAKSAPKVAPKTAPKALPKAVPQEVDQKRETEKKGKAEKEKDKEREKEKEKEKDKSKDKDKERAQEKDKLRPQDKDKERTQEKDKLRPQEKEKDRTHEHRSNRQGAVEVGSRSTKAGAADHDRDREKRRRRDGTDDAKDKHKEKESDRKHADSTRPRRRRRSGSVTSNQSEARKQVRRQQSDVPAEKERREPERAKRPEKERHRDREKEKDRGKAGKIEGKDKREDRENRKREKEPSPRDKDSSAKGKKEDKEKDQKEAKDTKEAKDAKDKADDSKKARMTKWGPTQEENKDQQLKEAAAQAAATAKLAEETKAALDKAKAEAAAVEAKKAEELAARKEKAAAARRAAPPPPWMAAQALFKASGSAETPSASSTSTGTEGAKKRKLDLKDLGDLQRALTEERNKMRLYIIKAKSEFEDRKEKGGAKEAGSTGEQEYYNAKVGEEVGPDNRLRVEALIGRGVFSSVYHCTDTKDGNTAVAIKFIRKNTMMRKAAEKEVEIYRRLGLDGPKEDAEGARHCINLASVGTFEHCGHLGVVFPLLKCDMRFALQRYGQGAGLPLPSVSQYVRQLLLALRTLRKVGVIHADLKPDNILMTLNKAEIQLCDFGSATDASEEQSMRTAYAQPRYYRAPEIILGVQHDTQIDVWSAGATMFELATGRILFTGKTNNQMLKQMLDVCGGFPKRMATEGEFSKKHFNSDGDFISKDPDSITGQPDVLKAGSTTKPARSMLNLLQAILINPAPNVAQSAHDKHVEQLAELVQGCLCIDTLERLSPSKALELPFFPKDR